MAPGDPAGHPGRRAPGDDGARVAAVARPPRRADGDAAGPGRREPGRRGPARRRLRQRLRLLLLLLVRPARPGRPRRIADGGAARPRRTAAAGRGRPTPGPPAASTVASLPDPGMVHEAQWATRGRVESVTISGSAPADLTRVRLPAAGVLPGGVRPTARSPRRRCSPVPGHRPEPAQGTGLPGRPLAELRAHRARPMVLVHDEPVGGPPRDTECTDVPAGPQALTFFAQDVPLAVAARTGCSPGLGRHRRLHGRLLRGQAGDAALRHVQRRRHPVGVLPHPAGRHDRRPVGRLPGGGTSTTWSGACSTCPRLRCPCWSPRPGTRRARAGTPTAGGSWTWPTPSGAMRVTPWSRPRRPQLLHVERRAAAGDQLALASPAGDGPRRLRRSAPYDCSHRVAAPNGLPHRRIGGCRQGWCHGQQGPVRMT